MNTPYDAEIAVLEQGGNENDLADLRNRWAKRQGYLAALQSPEVTALRKALEKLTELAILAGEMYAAGYCEFCTADALDHKSDGVLIVGRLNGRRIRTYHEATCAIIAARAALAPWKGEAK